MTWLNEWECADLLDRFDPSITPNLHAGAVTLNRLVGWTNRNSDGWAYWQKPSNAASKLMDLLSTAHRAHFRSGDREDCTEADLRRAYSPIKAMLTRTASKVREPGHDVVFPKSGPVEYEVTVSNIFTAESPEDALAQMAAWLDDNAYHAGYRVTNTVTHDSTFIDADHVDFSKIGA